MSKYIQGMAVALLFIGVTSPQVHAETLMNSTENKQEYLTDVTAFLDNLEQQIKLLRARIDTGLKTNLVEGVTDADIKKIQEILASDPAIYPDGEITGYFGALTREALKRFQARHELKVTGMIDGDTRTILNEYLKEKWEKGTAQGLLRTEGIVKKIELRILDNCYFGAYDAGSTLTPLCEKISDKYADDVDNSEYTSYFDVSATADKAGKKATVTFTVDEKKYSMKVDMDKYYGSDDNDYNDTLEKSLRNKLKTYLNKLDPTECDCIINQILTEMGYELNNALYKDEYYVKSPAKWEDYYDDTSL